MSLDAVESTQHDISYLLYRAIFSVWELSMACDTELRAVDNNLVEAVVS